MASLIPTPTSGDYSLYYHIPFCTKKCDYCHFFVLPEKEKDKEILLQGFRQEFQLRQPSGHLISIYFGGGTPSLFGPERIQEVISWSPACSEITLEVNPEGVSRKLIEAYKEAGVNRISLGVQSFDEKHLVQLGRTHTASNAERAVYLIREAGIDNVSIDLMYDLPNQDLQTWQKTVHSAARLPITHLSLYNLTIEPGTVFFKIRDQLEKQQPDPHLSRQMYQDAVKILTKVGLEPYEISAFAKPGFYSRHNTGYWLARPFLGLGPSAFSYWNHKRFRNVAHLGKYSKALMQNTLPIDFEEQLSPQAQERELFLIHLRLLQGAPLPSFTSELHPFVDAGLLTVNDRVQLTEEGILLYDSIAAELI